MRIVLGISGGIAAYKSAELVRLLQQRGHRVQVILTRAAREFVTPLTLASLSGEPVLSDLFAHPDRPHDRDAAIEHIAIAQAADVMVVAPATADLLARMAHGLADDLLTTLLLATPAPVVVAPAMNVQMWRHAATQANRDVLRARGVIEVPPAAGFLACGMVGEGRMAELEAIAAAAESAVQPRHDLDGETVLVTAGPTREALDPVRYLTNRSSGRMGYAVATAARGRGARVILISGPTALAVPPGVEFVPVTTAEEMAAAAESAFGGCTVAILTAAVADYRPASISPHKIRKAPGHVSLDLVATPDILARLGGRRSNQRLIGFAAETNPATALDAARAKLSAKNADLIVMNLVGDAGIGFDAEDNAVTLVTANSEQVLERAPKRVIAEQLWDAILRLPAHVHAHV